MEEVYWEQQHSPLNEKKVDQGLGSKWRVSTFSTSFWRTDETRKSRAAPRSARSEAEKFFDREARREATRLKEGRQCAPEKRRQGNH